MAKIQPVVFVLIVGFLSLVSSQWPLGPGFYAGMNRMMNNLNQMSVNLQAMGERLAREREAKFADDLRRSQEGVPFGDSGKVFITADGGLGYTYNSSDGSVTMYSISTTNPPSGYMYHVGPSGVRYNNW